MSASLIDGTGVTAVLDRLRASVDDLLDLDLTTVDRDGLLELCRGLETQRRRLPAIDHRLIAQLDERGVPRELAMRDSATMLARLLHIDPAEARARTAAAQDMGRAAPSPASPSNRCSPPSPPHRLPGKSPPRTRA